MPTPGKTAMPEPDKQGLTIRSRLAIVAVTALLGANVIVPLVWGDVYPFTSAPMFRDSPSECCSYQVRTGEGKEAQAEHWFCQRIYDGNPIGSGVGLRPPAVIEQEFGAIHDETAVRGHFQRQLAEPHH